LLKIIFALLFLVGCSANAVPIVFEVSNSHPLMLNAWVSFENENAGIVEFDMEYRLERFVDGDWWRLEYVNPPIFPNRTVSLAAGEWSNAYVLSWYLTHGGLDLGEYRIWKTFWYDGTAIDLSAEFSVSDGADNGVIERFGEVERLAATEDGDVLLVRIDEVLFALCVEAAIAADFCGNVLNFEDIPPGALVEVFSFGHIAIDGEVDGERVERVRNVRLIKVLP